MEGGAGLDGGDGLRWETGVRLTLVTLQNGPSTRLERLVRRSKAPLSHVRLYTSWLAVVGEMKWRRPNVFQTIEKESPEGILAWHQSPICLFIPWLWTVGTFKPQCVVYSVYVHTVPREQPKKVRLAGLTPFARSCHVNIQTVDKTGNDFV